MAVALSQFAQTLSVETAFTVLAVAKQLQASVETALHGFVPKKLKKLAVSSTNRNKNYYLNSIQKMTKICRK